MSIWRFRHWRRLIWFLLSSKESHWFHMFRFTLWFVFYSNFQFLSYFIFYSLIFLPVVLFLPLFDHFSGDEIIPILPFEFRNSILFLVNWSRKWIIGRNFPYWDLHDWKDEFFELIITNATVWLILDQKIASIVIAITTQNMLHIEYLKRNTRCSNNNRQQMINFRLLEFCTSTLLSLFLIGLLIGNKSQFSWNGEIPQSHQEYLL